MKNLTPPHPFPLIRIPHSCHEEGGGGGGNGGFKEGGSEDRGMVF